MHAAMTSPPAIVVDRRPQRSMSQYWAGIVHLRGWKWEREDGRIERGGRGVHYEDDTGYAGSEEGGFL